MCDQRCKAVLKYRLTVETCVNDQFDSDECRLRIVLTDDRDAVLLLDRGLRTLGQGR